MMHSCSASDHAFLCLALEKHKHVANTSSIPVERLDSICTQASKAVSHLPHPLLIPINPIFSIFLDDILHILTQSHIEHLHV